MVLLVLLMVVIEGYMLSMYAGHMNLKNAKSLPSIQ